MARQRLGEFLQEKGKIDHATLARVLADQRAGSQPLGELLLRLGLVSREDLVAALGATSRFDYLDLTNVVPDPDLIARVPKSVAQKYQAIPVCREKNRIIVAIVEPQNLQAIHDLSFLCGAAVVPKLAFQSDVEAAIVRYYDEAKPDASGETPDEPLRPFAELSESTEIVFATTSSNERAKAAMAAMQTELRNERTPAVRLVSAILVAAAQKGASDIHVEPQAVGALVRIRVDGIMRELTHAPAEVAASLISRMKILADMDISERRQPQDGRFLVQISGHSLDLRVSTLPTQYGEKVVMRLLDPKALAVTFDQLGFSATSSAVLRELLSLPQGMVLVTGPTGSGKSTTLYTFLHSIASPAVNVITVEDPVEYHIKDVNQVQVNARAGLTFASCLRSILRQDPNIIMVGEIRDPETAEIALQAAQTGHLVLSTLHTNDSIAAVTRLSDLGVPPFMVASSITAIVAQRLVRKLCSCAVKAPASMEFVTRMKAADIRDVPPYMMMPQGCPACAQTGYKGRVGIYELLVFDDLIRAAVRAGVRDNEIRDLARANDMRMMQEDALEKVARGVTTLEEVLRVVPFDSIVDSTCRRCHKRLPPTFPFCPNCGERAQLSSTVIQPIRGQLQSIRSGGH